MTPRLLFTETANDILFISLIKCYLDIIQFFIISSVQYDYEAQNFSDSKTILEKWMFSADEAITKICEARKGKDAP